MFPGRLSAIYACLPPVSNQAFLPGGAPRVAMSEFLEMGGYAGYVWPAYGVSAAAILGLAFFIWRRGRRLRKRLKEAEAARERNEAA